MGVPFFRQLVHRLSRRRDALSLAEEMEAHRALIQADLEAKGLPAADAARASRRTMGNMVLAREDARDLWVVAWADRLWRNIKYGLRGLRREPTFALAAILTLALGVATTTTVFSVVDAVLWKPLPLPQPDQLVAVYTKGSAPRASIDAISGADLVDWRAGAPALSGLAAEGRTAPRVLYLDHAESVRTTEFTPDYFSTLGRTAIAGRTFTPDDSPGARPAVLADRAWRRLFNADPSVVGRVLTLDADSITIIGIVHSDNWVGGDPDVFLMMDERSPAFLDRARQDVYGAIGRLQPGARAEVARAQLQAVADRVAQAFPAGRAGHTMFVRDLREYFTSSNWRPLYFFLGASLVVLLLSGVNVAALLVARALRRTREFALRGALGGGARAIAGQLLVEGALIAIPGGALGVLFTTWAIGVFSAALPLDLIERGTSSIEVDARVCAFALIATMLTTVAFALMPRLLARRIDLSSALGPGGRAGRSAGEGRARVVLLLAQVALTVVLLSGAAIFLKSFVALTRIPLGFDPVNVWAVRASLSGPRYNNDAQVRAYGETMLEHARAVPGVLENAIASTSPLGSGPLVFFIAADRPRPAAGEEPRAILRAVSSGYFKTLDIPIVRGRGIADADAAGAPRVAVVNQTLARQLFGGGNPLGQVVELLPARARWTNRPGALVVVGVAGNIKEVGINEIDFGDVYVPFAQMPAQSSELLVRARAPVASFGEVLRQAAANVDPSVPVTSVTTFEQRIDEAFQADRFNLLLICGFAGVAVLLAGIGLYGAVAYAVQARTRELGVRLALGAPPSRLVFATLWQAGRLAVVGGAIGLAGTLAIARLVGDGLYLVAGVHNGLLFGVTTSDPAMLASALLGILVVALVAGAVPARRVARIDPTLALRAE